MKLKKNKSIQISCDGGAATGKSTAAKMLAKKYKLKFLSSGLLYRYAAYLIIKFRPKNELLFLRKKFNKVSYNQIKKVSLHSPEISERSAGIAKKQKIRQILKNFKLISQKNKNCCIGSRDIAFNILPSSDVKFYLNVT